MAKVNKGRHTAAAGADGKILFLIGMRINKPLQFWKWLPVFVAMPRMLVELQKNRDLGLVGQPRTMLSGRVVTVWQYWNSFEQLQAYARSRENAHLPAWRRFNRRIRDNGSVDGDIASPRVAIAEGAHFRGSVDMQRAGSKPQQKPGGQPQPQQPPPQQQGQKVGA